MYLNLGLMKVDCCVLSKCEKKGGGGSILLFKRLSISFCFCKKSVMLTKTAFI